MPSSDALLFKIYLQDIAINMEVYNIKIYKNNGGSYEKLLDENMDFKSYNRVRDYLHG